MARELPQNLIPREAPRLAQMTEPEIVSPIDDIRNLMHGLNYGEFTAMTRAIGADPERAWAWVRGEA